MTTSRKGNETQTSGVLTGLQVWVEELIDRKLRSMESASSRPDPRALRQIRGMELTELAVRAGISHGTLSRLENGKLKRPKPETLARIAGALGVCAKEYREAVAALIQSRSLID